MKKLIFYILILITFVFQGCYKDDDIQLKESDEYYKIIENPSNETEQYIYDFYEKYKTIIIEQIKLSDYKYNFTTLNYIVATPISKDLNLIDEVFPFIEDIFSIYSDEFLKKHLPPTIQLAEKINQELSNGTVTDVEYPFVISNNFIMLSNLKTGFLEELDEIEKKNLIIDINIIWWHFYIYNNQNAFIEPEAFVNSVSTVNCPYEDGWVTWIGQGGSTEEEALHLLAEMGYLYWDTEKFGKYANVNVPTPGQNYEHYIKLMLTHSENEILEKYQNYPLVLNRYKILKAEIAEKMDYHFDKIIK